MKATLQDGHVIDLGPDTRAAIFRAGRLYRAGVFKHVEIEIPVPCCGWRSDCPIGGYATLHMAGFLSREERFVYSGDPDEYNGFDITYTVIADVEFTDEHGRIWKKGDIDEWLK